MLLYVGLLREDGTEPPSDSGYIRPYTAEFDLIPELNEFREFLFPAAVNPGYGLISSVGLFDVPEGGEPLKTWALPELVNVHEGVTPFLHGGKLMRGIEMSVRSLTFTKDVCEGTVYSVPSV
jgi:hypothetical protein